MIDRIELSHSELDISEAFVVFDQQDSGCVAFGVVARGSRWFVKRATTVAATASLENALRFHAAVRHPDIVRPVRVLHRPDLTLVYPWHSGTVLNHATTAGSDRTGLERFRRLPVEVAVEAIEAVLDAHVEVARLGFVAVDLYDGCLLFDFERRQMRLIDLDEYRAGPFVLESDRLPGSTSYMAPEELRRGSMIDERTTVFGLGRVIEHLLGSTDGWRGSAMQRQLVDIATAPDPANRFRSVAILFDRWTAARL